MFADVKSAFRVIGGVTTSGISRPRPNLAAPDQFRAPANPMDCGYCRTRPLRPQAFARTPDHVHSRRTLRIAAAAASGHPARCARSRQRLCPARAERACTPISTGSALRSATVRRKLGARNWNTSLLCLTASASLGGGQGTRGAATAPTSSASVVRWCARGMAWSSTTT